MNNKIELSLELVGALITEKTDLSQDDVNQYLKTNNIEADAKLAKNTAGEVNICLPYYSWIQKVRVQEATDASMIETSGGDHLSRLPPTSNSDEWNYRNAVQLSYNLSIIFDRRRPELADHSYDGDFNTHPMENRSWEIDQNNPK